MSFSFMLYDKEFDSKIKVSKEKLTVDELKVAAKFTPCTWKHPRNEFMTQTYSVHVYNALTKLWEKKSDDDIIDVSGCPRIDICLVHI